MLELKLGKLSNCESKLTSIFLIFGLIFIQIEPGISGLEFFVENWL